MNRTIDQRYQDIEYAMRAQRLAEEWYIEASRPILRRLADLYTCFAQPRFYVEHDRMASLPAELPDDLKPLERSLKAMLERLRLEALERAGQAYPLGFLVRNPAIW